MLKFFQTFSLAHVVLRLAHAIHIHLYIYRWTYIYPLAYNKGKVMQNAVVFSESEKEWGKKKERQQQQQKEMVFCYDLQQSWKEVKWERKEWTIQGIFAYTLFNTSKCYRNVSTLCIFVNCVYTYSWYKLDYVFMRRRRV